MRQLYPREGERWADPHGTECVVKGVVGRQVIFRETSGAFCTEDARWPIEDFLRVFRPLAHEEQIE